MVVNPLVEAAQGPDHVLVMHLVDEDLQVLRLPTRLGWHARPELEVHLALGSFPSIHKFAARCTFELKVHLALSTFCFIHNFPGGANLGLWCVED